MKALRLKHILGFGSLATALTLSACGPQPFTPSQNNSVQSAGSMNLPPKVDIVLGLSQNGTMRNIYTAVQNQMPAFLKKLENSGWDYRFVSIPLSEHFPTSNIAVNNTVSVSRYDTNTPSANWLPPFPGASYTDPSLGILSSLVAPYFVVTPLDTTYNDGKESGIQNQIDFLTRSDIRNNFIRPDALLAVMTLSNGDDRSGGTWAYDPQFRREMWKANSPDPITTYASTMLGLKSSPLLLKYYAMVAHVTTSCLYGVNWSGLRYEDFANRVNGVSIDLCNNTVESSLNAVAANLQKAKLAFRKVYLKIATAPNVATIKIIKYIGGNKNNAVEIPQNATNGWTYVGYVNSPGVYLYDSPVQMDLETGYMIRLNGSARMSGEDTVDISYQNAGTVSAN